MKRYLLLLCLLGVCNSASSQTGGFSSLYVVNKRPTTFENLVLNNDTIVLYGGGHKDTTALLYFGLSLIFMDTAGNTIQTKHFHLPDDYIVFPTDVEMKKLKSGGYVAVADRFIHKDGLFVKFNSAGEEISFHHFSVKNSKKIFLRFVTELENGYFLIAAESYMEDYNAYYVVKGIGKYGQELWSRIYNFPGSPAGSRSHVLRSFVQMDQNTFLLGGSETAPANVQPQQYWSRNHFTAIDTLGKVKWEWRGPINEESGAIGLKQTPDGGWVFATYTGKYDATNNYWKLEIHVVRRDSHFNLLWKRTLTPFGSAFNVIGDLEATPDGGWAVGAQWQLTAKPNGEGTYGYCLTKLNDQGDIVWTTCVQPPNGYLGDTYPGGMAVAPSGSVYWCLRFDRYSPQPSLSHGWLIKTDKDGCIDTAFCKKSSGLFDVPSKPQISVLAYPNPAQEQVTFELSTPAKPPHLVRVFDATGALVWQQAALFEQPRLVWRVQDVPPGLYFYFVATADGQAVGSGKVSILK